MGVGEARRERNEGIGVNEIRPVRSGSPQPDDRCIIYKVTVPFSSPSHVENFP